VAVFVHHQGTNVEFTVERKLHQGTASKRGVIVWLATFLFLFIKEKKKSPRQAIETCEAKSFYGKINLVHPSKAVR